MQTDNNGGGTPSRTHPHEWDHEIPTIHLFVVGTLPVTMGYQYMITSEGMCNGGVRSYMFSVHDPGKMFSKQVLGARAFRLQAL